MEPTPFTPSTAAALEQGRALFNAHRYFEAHEVWEGAWRRERGDLRSVLQGLIQVAAGYHKASVEQNALGAAKLLEMGLTKLSPWPDGFLGLSLDAFRARVAVDVGLARRWVESAVLANEPIRAAPLERAGVTLLPGQPRNKATRATAGLLGMLGGVLGVEHGVLELLQGDRPVDSLFIDAVHPSAGELFQGSEPALSLLPTLRLTGMAALLVGGVVVYWALARLHRRHGVLGFLGLSSLQVLFGGGLAQLPFVVLAAVLARWMDVPLAEVGTGWGARARQALGRLWPWCTALFLAAGALELGLAVFTRGLALTTRLPWLVFALALAVSVGAAERDRRPRRA